MIDRFSSDETEVSVKRFFSAVLTSSPVASGSLATLSATAVAASMMVGAGFLASQAHGEGVSVEQLGYEQVSEFLSPAASFDGSKVSPEDVFGVDGFDIDPVTWTLPSSLRPSTDSSGVSRFVVLYTSSADEDLSKVVVYSSFFSGGGFSSGGFVTNPVAECDVTAADVATIGRYSRVPSSVTVDGQERSTEVSFTSSGRPVVKVDCVDGADVDQTVVESVSLPPVQFVRPSTGNSIAR